MFFAFAGNFYFANMKRYLFSKIRKTTENVKLHMYVTLSQVTFFHLGFSSDVTWNAPLNFYDVAFLSVFIVGFIAKS